MHETQLDSGQQPSGRDPHPQVFVSKYNQDDIDITNPETIFDTLFAGLIAGTAGRDALDQSPVFVFLVGEEQPVEPLRFEIEKGNLKCWNGSTWGPC